MSARYQITVAQLKALLLFAAKRDIREYLQGVYFETDADGRHFAAASNGHMMLILRLADDVEMADPGSLLVARESIDLLVKHPATRGLEYPIEISEADGQPYAQLPGVRQPITLLDGRFPDWRRILPSGKQSFGHRGAHNPEYAKTVLDAQRLLTGSRRVTPAAPYSLQGPNDPLVYVLMERAVAVLMPLRANVLDAHETMNAHDVLGIAERITEEDAA